MSLFAEYYKERRGARVIEMREGFVVFQIHERNCHLAEIFVAPEARKVSVGEDLVRQMTKIALEQGCNRITATIDPASNGATDALHAALHIGMKLHGAGVGVVWLSKEIG